MRSTAHIVVKENPGAMRLAAGAERHVGNAFLIKRSPLLQA